MRGSRLSLTVVVMVFLLAASPCKQSVNSGKSEDQEMKSKPSAASAKDPYLDKRRQMVKIQIEARGVRDKKVLDAMLKVPRHEFIPERSRYEAYEDHPVPIGRGQTISQPYIVAYMTEALDLKGDEKVLEIGTGSGYQAAVLAEIVKKVYSIEIVCELEERAKETLKRLGYDNVVTKCADGYKGWAEESPFDAIIITAAPDEVPPPLLEQLKVGGRLIVPEGTYFQELKLYTRTEQGIRRKNLLPVRFVPMTGEAEKAGP